LTLQQTTNTLTAFNLEIKIKRVLIYDNNVKNCFMVYRYPPRTQKKSSLIVSYAP